MIRISASQIENYLRCRRYWAWKYIDKVPSKPSEATEFGSHVHALCEKFCADGTSPDPKKIWRYTPTSTARYPGKVALQLIAGLGSIMPLDVIRERGTYERGFEIPAEEINKYYNTEIPSDVTLVGFIDIAIDLGDSIAVIDHKTSSDPQKWGKSAEDLQVDVQKMLYSAMVPITLESCDVSNISFTLNYASSRAVASHAYTVGVESSAALVADDFRFRLVPTIIEMAELKRNKVPAAIQRPNPAACGMFRGCDFKSVCKLTSAERMKGFMMGNAMLESIRAKVEAKRLAAEGGVNPPEAAEAPEETPEIAKEDTKVVQSVVAEEKKTKGRGRPPKATEEQPKGEPTRFVPLQLSANQLKDLNYVMGVAMGCAPHLKEELDAISARLMR
jgi:hypothetical protein